MGKLAFGGHGENWLLGARHEEWAKIPQIHC